MARGWEEEREEQRFDSLHGHRPDCLSRLEAEVALLYDAGFDTHERIWTKLQTHHDSPDSLRNLLTVEDVRVMLRKLQMYLKMYPARSGPGRPRALTWSSYRFLQRLMRLEPAACGYRAAGWTKGMILDCLRRWGDIRISVNTLTDLLHDAGFYWDGEAWRLRPWAAPTPSEQDVDRIRCASACGCLDDALYQEDLKRINLIPPHPKFLANAGDDCSSIT